ARAFRIAPPRRAGAARGAAATPVGVARGAGGREGLRAEDGEDREEREKRRGGNGNGNGHGNENASRGAGNAISPAAPWRGGRSARHPRDRPRARRGRGAGARGASREPPPAA